MMKITAIVGLLALTVANAAAFVPSTSTTSSVVSSTELFGIKTGPKGKAAKSKEEDLELTRSIIMDHIGSVPDELVVEKKVEEVAIAENEEEDVGSLRKLGRKIKGKIRKSKKEE
mmetsp:Transcript_10599/g.14200  ORF Transcript_10599/g.14200 Transcript_10599/m.14200 type:complete len:115 (-) Transcript_10599:335-679(-)